MTEVAGFVALVARELREHLLRPSTRARLVIAGREIGLSAEQALLLVDRWTAMLERKEGEQAGPVTLRGERMTGH